MSKAPIERLGKMVDHGVNHGECSAVKSGGLQPCFCLKMFVSEMTKKNAWVVLIRSTVIFGGGALLELRVDDC